MYPQPRESGLSAFAPHWPLMSVPSVPTPNPAPPPPPPPPRRPPWPWAGAPAPPCRAPPCACIVTIVTHARTKTLASNNNRLTVIAPPLLELPLRGFAEKVWFQSNLPEIERSIALLRPKRQ